MSLAPLHSVINNVAGTHAAQLRGDTERNSQEVSAQQRVAQLSAGTEQVNGESSTHERDADGRLPYQRPGQRNADAATSQEADATSGKPPLPAKDPTGETGIELDLIG